MSKVYESLKEVVTLQRNKNDPVDLPGGKTRASSSLDGEIGELVQKVSRFRAAATAVTDLYYPSTLNR